MAEPPRTDLVKFWNWRDLTHQQRASDEADRVAFAERATELCEEIEFLLAGGLSEGAEEALGTLAEQDMSDFCIMVDLSVETPIEGVPALNANTREHLAQFLDHEPWHSLMVDTDLTVAIAMSESLALREDTLPWYEVTPNLVRMTARVLDQANAEQLRRFAGELQALHQRSGLGLPADLNEMLQYLVENACKRLGLEPFSFQ